MLRVVRGTFFGESKRQFSHARDAATPFARLPYVVLILALFVTGSWPKPMLSLIDASVRPLIERVAPGRGRPAGEPITVLISTPVSVEVR